MLDTSEFNRLARKYMNTVYRVAFSYLKSQPDADDVTQNVLLALYQTDKHFESDCHAKNWLVKVTINECRKIWRMPGRKNENIDDYIHTLSFEDKSYFDLFSAIMKLDKAKRLVIILHYLEGYEIREISEMLGVPMGTVGTRLSRARHNLRDYLEEAVNER